MIKPGIYRHLKKDTLYKVLTVGIGPEPDKQSYVVYQRMYNDCATRVISLPEFEKKMESFNLDSLEFYYDKIALLCIHDRKVLMARSKGKKHFYMPGGKREPGESDVDCLVRECREELGIEVDPKSAFLYGVYSAFAYADKPCAKLTIYQARFSGNPAPSSEIEEIDWISYTNREKAIGSGRTLLDELYWKGLVD